MKLTQKAIDSLPRDGSGRKYADDKIRLYLKQGKRHHTYFTNYELPETGKKSHYHFIGRSTVISLNEARTMARAVWARLDQKLPPVEEPAERGLPWSEVAENFINHQMTRQDRPRKARTVYDYRRYLLQGPIPMDKDVRTISRADWTKYAETYKKGTVQRQFLQNASSCMSRAVRRGEALENPIPDMIKDYAKPKVGERVLSGPEFCVLWRATADGQGGDYAAIIRLIALTGCRLREICRLRKSEVDLKAGLLHIPADRMKNGQPHNVILSPSAIAILRGVEDRPGECVFGAAGNGFQSESKGQSALRKRMSAVADESVAARVEELGEWTPHDLRRTMYSWLRDDGLAGEATISRIVGHSKQGLVKVYASDQERDRRETRLEIKARQAVADWADYVEAVVDA